MQHEFRIVADLPEWQAASGRRLNISMLVATLLVASILSVLQFPTVEKLAPLTLVVDIVPPKDVSTEPSAQVQVAPEQAAAQSEDSTTQRTELPDPQPAASSARAIAEPAELAVTETAIDWEAEKSNAVRDTIDDLQTIVSVNPNFDRKRSEAAVRFRPSEAPVKKEIWDNVEKDYLGRTILRSGDCYRILDDPSAVNRDVFETFGQYMTHCEGGRYVGVELPWVEEIRNNFNYLREREERLHGRIRENQDLLAE